MEDVLLPPDSGMGASASLNLDPGNIHPGEINSTTFQDALPNLADFGNEEEPTFSFHSIDVVPDFFDRASQSAFPPLPSMPITAKPIVDTSSSAFPPREHFSSPVTNRAKGMQDWPQSNWAGKLFGDTVPPMHAPRPRGIRAVLQEFSRESSRQQHILCKHFLSLIHRNRERVPVDRTLFDKDATPEHARTWHLPPRSARWRTPASGISVDSARPPARAPPGVRPNATHSASTALSSGAPFKLCASRPANAAERRLKAAGQDGLAASRHCHICCRPARAAEPHIVCGNLAAGVCRKSICQRCFADVPWTGKVSAAEAGAQGAAWRCPHCAETCPDRAQCFVYRRTSERRRQRRNARRAAAAAPVAEARWRAPKEEEAPAPAAVAEWLVDPAENATEATVDAYNLPGNAGEAGDGDKAVGEVVVDFSDSQSGSVAEPCEKKQKTGDGAKVDALLSAPADDMTTPVSPLSPTVAVAFDVKGESKELASAEAKAEETPDVHEKCMQTAANGDAAEQDPLSLPDVDGNGDVGMEADFLFQSLMSPLPPAFDSKS